MHKVRYLIFAIAVFAAISGIYYYSDNPSYQRGYRAGWEDNYVPVALNAINTALIGLEAIDRDGNSEAVERLEEQLFFHGSIILTGFEDGMIKGSLMPEILKIERYGIDYPANKKDVPAQWMSERTGFFGSLKSIS